jgi:hypothetical protein
MKFLLNRKLKLTLIVDAERVGIHCLSAMVCLTARRNFAYPRSAPCPWSNPKMTPISSGNIGPACSLLSWVERLTTSFSTANDSSSCMSVDQCRQFSVSPLSLSFLYVPNCGSGPALLPSSSFNSGRQYAILKLMPVACITTHWC